MRQSLLLIILSLNIACEESSVESTRGQSDASIVGCDPSACDGGTVNSKDAASEERDTAGEERDAAGEERDAASEDSGVGKCEKLPVEAVFPLASLGWDYGDFDGASVVPLEVLADLCPDSLRGAESDYVRQVVGCGVTTVSVTTWDACHYASETGVLIAVTETSDVIDWMYGCLDAAWFGGQPLGPCSDRVLVEPDAG